MKDLNLIASGHLRMKVFNMAEPAMNDRLPKGGVGFEEMLMVSNVFQHYELMFTSNI